MTSVEKPHFPFSRQDRYNPPPENEELRRKCPVAKVKLFDGNEAWLLTKREDVVAALESPNLSADRRTAGYPEIHQGGAKAKEKRPTFVNLDDPDHAKQRALLEEYFTPEAVQKLRPMIEKTVKDNIDQLLAKYGQHPKEPVDLVQEFAVPVPTQIIYRVLGVPEEDIEKLSHDSEVRTSTSRNAAETSNTNLQDYIKQLVDKRIADPKDDLISHLVQGPYKEGKLEKEDLPNLAFLVLVAGNAALINSIALGVLTFHEHPEQLRILQEHPGSAPQAVNELLRYHTASALNSRRAVRKEFELGGQQFKEAEGVICSVQSADRDEGFYSNADKFDIERDHKPSDVMGFGHGPHRCQGEWLSRVELEAVFCEFLKPAVAVGLQAKHLRKPATLYRRLPDLKVAVSSKDLQYSPPEQNVGIQGLPVTW